MLQLQTAGMTDVGQKREGNEDAFFVDDEHQLYVVADGMGGHLAGEVASGIVVDTIRAAVADGDHPLPGDMDEAVSLEGNLLLAWIKTANRNVFRKSQSDEQCRGMGSTIAVAYCTDSTLLAANVGDSPIYMVRDGEIELISVTHTVAAEQAAVNPDRLRLLPEKFLHMLSRAIGVSEEVEPDVCETPCFEGDAYILCSDGLSNMVKPEEMIDVVQQGSAMDACRRFIDMANERGGDDNITVIVIKVMKKNSSGNPLLRFILKLLGKRQVAFGLFNKYS